MAKQSKIPPRIPNPYFEPVCSPSPLNEIYELLPRLQQLETSDSLTEDDAQYLEALSVYTRRVNTVVLRGLQGTCGILSQASCNEVVQFANRDLMNLADLLCLNLDLVTVNMELERAVMQTMQKPALPDNC